MSLVAADLIPITDAIDNLTATVAAQTSAINVQGTAITNALASGLIIDGVNAPAALAGIASIYEYWEKVKLAVVSSIQQGATVAGLEQLPTYEQRLIDTGNADLVTAHADAVTRLDSISDSLNP